MLQFSSNNLNGLSQTAFLGDSLPIEGCAKIERCATLVLLCVIRGGCTIAVND